MMFKKVFAAAASALAIAAFAGNAMARDTLRVGTEPTFAPFEFLDTKTRSSPASTSTSSRPSPTRPATTSRS